MSKSNISLQNRLLQASIVALTLLIRKHPLHCYFASQNLHSEDRQETCHDHSSQSRCVLTQVVLHHKAKFLVRLSAAGFTAQVKIVHIYRQGKRLQILKERGSPNWSFLGSQIYLKSKKAKLLLLHSLTTCVKRMLRCVTISNQHRRGELAFNVEYILTCLKH